MTTREHGGRKPRCVDARICERTLGPAKHLLVVAVLVGLGGVGASTQEPKRGTAAASGVKKIGVASDSRPKARWMVSTTTRLVIGGDTATGVYRLEGVSYAGLHRSGAIAVGLLNLGELRVYGPNGRYQRTIGGFGAGEGRFRALWRAHINGDSIIGFNGRDVGQAFRWDGRYLGIVTRRSFGGRDLLMPRTFPGGATAGVVRFGGRGLRPGIGDSVLMVVVGRSGGERSIGSMPWREWVTSQEGKLVPLTFGPALVSATVGDLLCFGFSRAYEIRCVSESGEERVRILRTALERRRIAIPDTLRFFAAVDSANPLPRGAAARQSARRTTVFADSTAAFGRLIGTPDSLLWVGPAMPEDAMALLNPLPMAPSRWHIYHVAGGWIGDVDLPAGFRPLAAERSSVIGLSRSSKGQEVITRLALIAVEQ